MGQKKQLTCDLSLDQSSAPKIQPSLKIQSDNMLITTSSPILGMVTYLHRLKGFNCSSQFWNQLIAELTILKQNWLSAGYSETTANDALFFLCTLIDETLLNLNSHDLFVNHFFQKVWGGDEVFTILDNYLNEIEQSQHLLTFFQHCFIFGLKGRYRTTSANLNEFTYKLAQLNAAIKRTTSLDWSTDHHIYQRKYKAPRFLGYKIVVITTIVLLFALYFFYQFQLNQVQTDILQKIQQLMGNNLT